jgi:hypothetical protein
MPKLKWKKNQDVWFTTSPIGHNLLRLIVEHLIFIELHWKTKCCQIKWKEVLALLTWKKLSCHENMAWRWLVIETKYHMGSLFFTFFFIPFHLEFVFFVCLSSIIWYSFLACVFSYGFQSLFCFKIFVGTIKLKSTLETKLYNVLLVKNWKAIISFGMTKLLMRKRRLLRRQKYVWLFVFSWLLSFWFWFCF